MAGMTDLQQMLDSLTVRRRVGEFVFVLVPTVQRAVELRPEAVIREDEGVTAVIERSTADQAGLAYDYVAAWLTLEVHSSLEAVGLTAAFSAVLGSAGISCNVLAGLHHDHLLVQHQKPTPPPRRWETCGTTVGGRRRPTPQSSIRHSDGIAKGVRT